MNAFKGVGVALITPFKADKSIDYPALARLVEYVLQGNVDYLVVNGTTGEASTIDFNEKAEVLRYIGETNNKRVPLLYGIGANDTQFVLNTIKQTDFTYIDAILTVSPYYNKPSQEGIYQHYMAIADAAPKPLMLYNVPGRTGINIEASTTIRLSAHPNIFGIKEASGNLNQCLDIIKSKPDDFMLISGDDLLTVPMISIGAEGIISVLANAFPTDFTKMIHLALDGKFKESTDILKKFIDINGWMYTESNPVGVKEVLRQRGVCDEHVRLPLVPASAGLVQNITNALVKNPLK